MSSTGLDLSTLSKERRAEIERALDALRRAAAMARKIAIDTNTEIVMFRDGKVVRISAAKLREAKGQFDKRRPLDRRFVTRELSVLSP